MNEQITCFLVFRQSFPQEGKIPECVFCLENDAIEYVRSANERRRGPIEALYTFDYEEFPLNPKPLVAATF